MMLGKSTSITSIYFQFTSVLNIKVNMSSLKEIGIKIQGNNILILSFLMQPLYNIIQNTIVFICERDCLEEYGINIPVDVRVGYNNQYFCMLLRCYDSSLFH